MAYEITVPVRHRMFWLAFTDLERMMRCVPGALVDGVADNGEVAGRLRLRVAGSTITYRGTVRVLETIPETCTLVLGVDGEQSRGSGVASGTLTVRLHRAGSGTRAVVEADLEATGRLTTFDRDECDAALRKLADGWLEQLVAQFRQPGPVPDPGVEPMVASGSLPDDVPLSPDEVYVEEDVDVELEPEAAVEVAQSAEIPLEREHGHEESVANSVVTHTPAVATALDEPDLWPLGGPRRPRWFVMAAGMGAALAVGAAWLARRLSRSVRHRS